MMQKAIAHINGQMQKSPEDRQLEVIGQYLIDRCRDEGTAAALLAKGKSLSGCMAEIRREAQRQAVHNCAMIASYEVFAMAARYYGLEEKKEPDAPALAPEMPAPAPSALPSLDDFL